MDDEVKEGEGAIKAAAPAKVSIDDLMGKTDAELSKLLGLDAELAMFKTKLAEASTLTGKARTYVEEKIAQRLQPNLDSRDISWMIEDAKRMSAKGKEAMTDCSPCSVI